MKLILTDAYIKSQGQLYQTIPQGVNEAPGHQDQTSSAPVPFGPRPRRSKQKIIKPKQQVESVLVDAINGISVGGDPNHIRKVGAQLYLQLHPSLFKGHAMLDELTKDAELLKDFSKISDIDIIEMLSKLFLFYRNAEDLATRDINLDELNIAQKYKLIKKYGEKDEFNTYMMESAPIIENQIKRSQTAFVNIDKLSAKLAEVQAKINLVDY